MVRWRILVSGLVLSLAACGGPPESRVALSEPGGAAYDQRLAGIWYHVEKTEAFFLHITPRNERLDVVAVAFGYEKGNPARWLRATAHASKIDGRTYYNVKRAVGVGDDYGTAEEEPGFIILQAEISADDALNLCFTHERTLEDLINGGLSGREVKGDYKGEEVPYLLLDLSRSELISLLRETTPEKLFRCDRYFFRRLAPSPDKPD